MKEWAKTFYNSDAWRDCRAAYLSSIGYLCERCGNKLQPAKIVHHKIYLTPDNISDPNVSLCFDNLEALCQDCHNKEHHKELERIRYKFDEDGNILPP